MRGKLASELGPAACGDEKSWSEVGTGDMLEAEEIKREGILVFLESSTRDAFAIWLSDTASPVEYPGPGVDSELPSRPKSDSGFGELVDGC